MHQNDYEDYKNYSANLYRLSRKFIESANIIIFEDITRPEFGLNIELNDVSLIIEYQGDQLNNILSDSDIRNRDILSYFGNEIIFSYEIIEK